MRCGRGKSRAKISNADFGYHCNSYTNLFALQKVRLRRKVRFAHLFVAIIPFQNRFAYAILKKQNRATKDKISRLL